MASLGDVCQINPKKSEINDLDKGTSVSFIPMEDLEAQRMLFVPKKERLLGEVYKGYTYFRECDVILAKVTPCFENGKSGIARNLKNGIGFGSSEYFILRASEQILPEYIYRIIARPLFIEAGKSHMTGTGGLQRVPIDFVTHYQIPLPPLDVQREIVAEIEGYQKIVDGARQVVEAWKPNIELELEEERKSAGVEAWEVVKLGEVLSFVGSGVTPLGGKETYLNDGILFIRSQNVLWGICDLSDAAFISQEVHDEMSRSKVKKK
jgi:type I restriction enzyme M protein